MKSKFLPLLQNRISRPGLDTRTPHHHSWHLLNAIFMGLVGWWFANTFLSIPDQSSWGETVGLVTSAKLVQVKTGKFNQRDSLKPEIQYKYSVDGKEYTSTQVQVGGTDGTPENVVDKYKSKKVTVFFDPQKPSEAALEKGYNSTSYKQLIFLITVMGIGILFELIKFFRREPEFSRN